MNFQEFTERYRKDIYNTIVKYVPIKEPKEHYKIMRDYIDRQGKYRRPALLLLTAQMYGASASDAMLPAAAQQLSEDWILMQDDAEDDSEMRRGKPAAQRLYGWVNAVNATNTGHIAMWRMIKDYMLKAGPEKGNLVYEKFYDMLETTVEGQFVENSFIHDTKDLSIASESMYFKIVDSKTCFYTIYGPMQIGALVGDGKDKDLKMLKEIGDPAGYAFQIVDDILDMTADEKAFGKKNNGDLFEGKLTIPVLHAYKSANAEEKKKLDLIYKKKRQEKSEDEIQYIRRLMTKYKSIEYAQKMADDFGKKAEALVKQYKSQMPRNEYTDLLLSAMEEMYVRKK